MYSSSSFRALKYIYYYFLQNVCCSEGFLFMKKYTYNYAMSTEYRFEKNICILCCTGFGIDS